jgi:hypothetical protein
MCAAGQRACSCVGTWNLMWMRPAHLQVDKHCRNPRALLHQAVKVSPILLPYPIPAAQDVMPMLCTIAQLPPGHSVAGRRCIPSRALCRCLWLPGTTTDCLHRLCCTARAAGRFEA